MLGILIILVSLGVGFAAGYVTRGKISRKRRAEYLRYEPYISPSRRPEQPPMREAASGPVAMAYRLLGRKNRLSQGAFLLLSA
jgi:hypothetical protein